VAWSCAAAAAPRADGGGGGGGGGARGARRRSGRCIFWSISPEHVELANVFEISRREPASLGARLIEFTWQDYIDACAGTKMTNFREKPVPGELLAIFSGTVSDSVPVKTFLKNVPPGCIHCLTMGFFSAQDYLSDTELLKTGVLFGVRLEWISSRGRSEATVTE